MSLADQSQQWYPTSVQVIVLQARSLRIKGKNGTNDAYAIMQVAKDKFATSVVEKTVSPVWKEEASFDLPLIGNGIGNAERTLHVHVMHRALVGPDKLLGQAVINLLELSEIQSPNKTEWFKLLDKAGKPDKDRGEVLVSIQFMRNNMTASMFDLSATDKPRSRLGKLKDKVRGKKKEGLSDSASAVVPSFTQVLTDSEGEGEGGAGADKEEKKKKHKLKSLFSTKSNLQRNVSQSMSVLGPLPERSSSLTGSRSSGLNLDASEGKKKFKFLTHKRSGSSDSKGSQGPLSFHGPSKPGSAPAAEQSNLCINGSHVYTDEPQPRRPRTGSTFSLASSGHGSMEDLRRAQGRKSSTTSIDSLRAQKQPSPWAEESHGAEQEEEEEEGTVKSVMEQQRRKFEEERRGVDEEEEQVRREEEEERMRALEEEGRRRRLEEERVRGVEQERKRLDEEKREEERRVEEEQRVKKEAQERKRLDEEKRVEEEKRRVEEEQRVKEEEQEKRRLEHQEQRRIDEEKRRTEEEKVRVEEEERRREEELERRRIIEAEEHIRLEEEERAAEERNKKREEEEEEEERVRLEKQESERLEEERRTVLEEERLRKEEALVKRREEEEQLREEEERRMKDEEERERREGDELRKAEERRRKEEEERLKLEDRLREEEKEEERTKREKEKRTRREEEDRTRREEEERTRREEEERLKREDRLREEEIKRRDEERRMRDEEEERRMRDEEERVRKEEEEYRLRKEEEERTMRDMEEKKRREEERRKEEGDRLRQEEEDRLRLEEEEEERRKEERERIVTLERERLRKEGEERMKLEEERREQEERRRVEEQRRKRMEEEEGARVEEEMREEEKRRRAQDGIRPAEVQKQMDRREITDEALVGDNPLTNPSEDVGSTNPFEDVGSTNPFEDVGSTNPFEETSTASPTGLFTRSTKVSAVKPSPTSCALLPQPSVPSSPFLTPSEPEGSTNPPVGLADANASRETSADVMEKKRRAPLPPDNQRLPRNCNAAAVSLAQAMVAKQAPPLSTSATESVGSEDDHRSKAIICAGPDRSGAPRDKRPAPRPPGSLRGKPGGQVDQRDQSARMTAPLRSSSAAQAASHGNQTMDHTDIPSATGGFRVAKHNKGPAPLTPHSSSLSEKMGTNADVEYPANVEKHSLAEPSDEKHNLTRRDPPTPIFKLNPFNLEREIQSVGLGDREIDGIQEGLQSPFSKNEDVTSPKSLKTFHAPMPPVKITPMSREEAAGLSKTRQSTGPLTVGLVVKRQTHRIDVERPGDTSTKPPCVSPSPVLSTLGSEHARTQPEPREGTLLQAGSQVREARPMAAHCGGGEEARGKGDKPASTSRRPHPVKPLSSSERESASGSQGAEVDQSAAVPGGLQEKMKVQGSGVKGPFSQLTPEELISLLGKQKKQLTEKDRKITQLEQYIDNLLVRVIDEAPSILMSLNSLKK